MPLCTFLPHSAVCFLTCVNQSCESEWCVDSHASVSIWLSRQLNGEMPFGQMSRLSSGGRRGNARPVRGRRAELPGDSDRACVNGQFCVSASGLLESTTSTSQVLLCSPLRHPNLKKRFLCSSAANITQRPSSHVTPSTPTVEERKECYYNLNDANFCDNVLSRNTTKQECCCTVGAGWGDNCEIHACPVSGRGADKFAHSVSE